MWTVKFENNINADRCWDKNNKKNKKKSIR